MSSVLLMTDAVEPSDHILPALGLLAHQVRVIPADATALLDGPTADLILVDARRDLPGARSLCRVIQATGSDMPVLLILGEGGLAAVAADWGSTTSSCTPPGPGSWKPACDWLQAGPLATTAASPKFSTASCS